MQTTFLGAFLQTLYSFLASGDFFHLLIMLTNSLDPDQAQDQQNISPDLGLNHLAL